MKDEHFAYILISIAAVFILVILLMNGSFTTQSDETTATLASSGFTEMVLGKSALFACGEGDKVGRYFRARNPRGDMVSGIVCCGILKGCTVRFPSPRDR